MLDKHIIYQVQGFLENVNLFDNRFLNWFAFRHHYYNPTHLKIYLKPLNKRKCRVLLKCSKAAEDRGTQRILLPRFESHSGQNLVLGSLSVSLPTIDVFLRDSGFLIISDRLDMSKISSLGR